MKVIGITGGIGSGKSLVAKIMMDMHGAYFLNTDQIAKEQMEVGGTSYAGVVDYFGHSILAEDGSIDREKLSKIVFKDEEKLQKLNDLTHPQVLEAVQGELAALRKSGEFPYVIIETALMIEAGFDFICDEVWYVYAPEEIRRQRLKRERNYSDQKIDSIFEKQSKEEEFRKRFSKVITNVGDIHDIEQQVEELIFLTNFVK
ncbi:MAG: dephospho-CoA kinase [Clostridiales bacterium]|nr:dephospho-CoA kinase [Clostridiales bacterium]